MRPIWYSFGKVDSSNRRCGKVLCVNNDHSRLARRFIVIQVEDPTFVFSCHPGCKDRLRTSDIIAEKMLLTLTAMQIIFVKLVAVDRLFAVAFAAQLHQVSILTIQSHKSVIGSAEISGPAINLYI